MAISTTHQSRLNLISVIWMVMWSFTTNINMALNKFLSFHESPYLTVFIRLFIGAVMLAPFIWNNKENFIPEDKSILKKLFLRGVLMSIAMGFTYYAYGNLPLAFATSIGFTGPLITAVLAFFLLGDKLSKLQWVLILIGYMGVLVLTRPTEATLSIAIWAALGANLFASLSMIVTKKLAGKIDSTLIMVYGYLVGMILMLGLAVMNWHTPTGQDLLILVGIAGSATLSQFARIKALEKSDAAIISPFEYLRLVVAVPLGYLLFAEVPTLWTFAGAMIIVASTVFLTWVEIRQNKAQVAQ